MRYLIEMIHLSSNKSIEEVNETAKRPLSNQGSLNNTSLK